MHAQTLSPFRGSGLSPDTGETGACQGEAAGLRSLAKMLGEEEHGGP